jgi:carboxypeptidase family protein
MQSGLNRRTSCVASLSVRFRLDAETEECKRKVTVLRRIGILHQRARGRRLASVCKHRLAVALAVCLAAVPGQLLAQGEIVGRVVSEVGELPIAGAQVTIARLGRSAVTDSVGKFRLSQLPSGDHQLVLRALGYLSDSVTIEVDDDVAVRDFVLKRQAQTLPTRQVVGESPPLVERLLSEYYDRRKMGIGHFVTREDFEKAEGGGLLTGEVLAKLPGVRVVHGEHSAWVATGRTANSKGGCAFGVRVPNVSDCGNRSPTPADQARGARAACYMDVYLDGAVVFAGNPQSGLFDVNSLEPAAIEAIEVFTSAAQVPVKYNRTSNGCGVLLIWTRRSP